MFISGLFVLAVALCCTNPTDGCDSNFTLAQVLALCQITEQLRGLKEVVMKIGPRAVEEALFTLKAKKRSEVSLRRAEEAAERDRNAGFAAERARLAYDSVCEAVEFAEYAATSIEGRASSLLVIQEYYVPFLEDVMLRVGTDAEAAEAQEAAMSCLQTKRSVSPTSLSEAALELRVRLGVRNFRALRRDLHRAAFCLYSLKKTAAKIALARSSVEEIEYLINEAAHEAECVSPPKGGIQGQLPSDESDSSNLVTVISAVPICWLLATITRVL
ncbi:hypothetical protein DPX39_000057200 [Trypanosoma brucei equiperdum]|uniref:Trypanosoma glutamic acid/alanine-rich protein domain-containing protein n=1 Tax=Trypanosoma brucei equiperdum TaxID=630700 RepID=A0A3L6KRK2_9TRYP|nr:hypothetical protein DPX39_000057200 [Trypanosoma brucei equiperdum]